MLEQLYNMWDDDLEIDHESNEREYQEELMFNPWISYDCSNIPSGKLERFIKGNNTYRRFDKEFAAYDVVQAYQWYDPLHLYAEHNGIKKADNKIRKLIRKLSKGGISIDELCKVIKAKIDYRKCNIYKSAADYYIDAFYTRTDWYWEYRMWGYEKVNGVLWRKEEMIEYLGYGYIMHKYTINRKTMYRYEKVGEWS